MQSRGYPGSMFVMTPFVFKNEYKPMARASATASYFVSISKSKVSSIYHVFGCSCKSDTFSCQCKLLPRLVALPTAVPLCHLSTTHGAQISETCAACFYRIQTQA